MLSIHWLYRKSRNSVVKTFGVDVIVTSHTTSTCNMADVNILECDSLVTPLTLNSNVGDQKVCKKRNLSWLFGADRKVQPSGSLQSLVMPNSDPRTDFSSRTSYSWKILIVSEIYCSTTHKESLTTGSTVSTSQFAELKSYWSKRLFRSFFASAQSRQSLRCSHTWTKEVDEGSDQHQTCSPTGWLRMCIWRIKFTEDKKCQNLMRWLKFQFIEL